MHLENHDDAFLLFGRTVFWHLVTVARQQIEQCCGINLLIMWSPVDIKIHAPRIGPGSDTLLRQFAPKETVAQDRLYAAGRYPSVPPRSAV